MKKIIALLLTGAIVVLVGCSPQQGVTEKKDKVTVSLDWVPNTNHTGLYVAKDKGYYEQNNLDVDIIQPSQDTAIELVATGKADFAISFQEDVTMARTGDNPLPIIAVAAVIQHNTSGFAALSSLSIRTPKDLENKRYGGWGKEIEEKILNTFMEKHGADPEKVEIFSDNSTDFIQGVTSNRYDFEWIYYGWEGIACAVKGIDIDFFKLQDYDSRLDFYTPVIITSEKLIKENPDKVRNFLQATKKGYTDCVTDPVGSVEYLLKNAPETDRQVAVESAKYLANEYISDALSWGIMNPEIWQTFTQFLYENGIINDMPDIDKMFTNEFVE